MYFVEVIAFNAFLGSLPHKFKIVIAGNHDTTFDRAFYPQHWTRFRHRQQYGAYFLLLYYSI